MVAYSFQKRFIDPILAGLGEDTGAAPKRQTIRNVGRRRHARSGEVLQLYTGMRTKQCRKIGEAICKGVEPIRIFVESGVVDLPESCWSYQGAELDNFARQDGFQDWADMRQFWRDEHGELVRLGPFVGVLITWEPRA